MFQMPVIFRFEALSCDTLLFFILTVSFGLFVWCAEGVPPLTIAFFLWFSAVISLFFSFDALIRFETLEAFDVLWLAPLHPWQIIGRLVIQHLFTVGFPLWVLLGIAAYGASVSTELCQGLLLGFGGVLLPLSCLGILMRLVSIGAMRGILLQAFLLFPLALPALLLGWEVVRCEGQMQQAWPCLLGLFGLWCIQGCITFFLGSWTLKQRILT